MTCEFGGKALGKVDQLRMEIRGSSTEPGGLYSGHQHQSTSLIG